MRKRDPVMPYGYAARIEGESIIVAELADGMYRNLGTQSDIGDGAFGDLLVSNVTVMMAGDRGELVSTLRRIGAIALRWTVAIQLGMPEIPIEQEELPF